MFDTKKYEEELQREREERAARVKRFVAEQEEQDIADLFDAMRDMLDEKEADETFYLRKFFQQIGSIVSDFEERICS